MKILVCNPAHIGDVILTTAVLPVLKSAFPEAKIGMLIGSWSRNVVENHQLVDFIHLFDHPVLNRSNQSNKAKKKRGSKTWQKVLPEIADYDLAFDMYSLFPTNAGNLLYKAGVPERVGFWLSLAKHFYNHQIFSLEVVAAKKHHIVEQHGSLLRGFGIAEDHLQKLKPTLEYKNRVQDPQHPKEYVVVHMGVGGKKREWNTLRWKELALKLETLGLPIVYVGRGRKEREEIAEATHGLKNPLNFCDTLEWRELLPLIQNARLLIGLESMAGHMAAVMQTPSVVIYGGTASVASWRPYSDKCQIVTPPEELFENGFALPEAIHCITASDVFEKVKLVLSQ